MTTIDTLIEDGFDFIFRGLVQDGRWWWRYCSIREDLWIRGMVTSKEGNMEDRVHLEGRR